MPLSESERREILARVKGLKRPKRKRPEPLSRPEFFRRRKERIARAKALDDELLLIARETPGHEELTVLDAETRERARKLKNQRDHRARMRTEGLAASAPEPAIAVISKKQKAEEILRIKEWLAIGGPQQRSIKRRAADVVKSRFVLLEARGSLGREPSFGEFAERLNGSALVTTKIWTRFTARKRLELLHRLELTGGPWHVEPSPQPTRMSDDECHDYLASLGDQEFREFAIALGD